MNRTLSASLSALWLLGSGMAAEIPAPPPVVVEEREADPPSLVGQGRGALRSPAGTDAYDSGNATDEEQLYLELINRSRADPAAEGRRISSTSDPDLLGVLERKKVDLDRFRREMAAFPPAQPLAFEPRLLAAARAHTSWMKQFGLQTHSQTDPQTGAVLNTPKDRIEATGYPWQRIGESIFANALSEDFGHAAFLVDWGANPGEIQNPPGHRLSNFQPEYREVGIGVLNGFGPNDTGPQFVTIDFAARQKPVPLVTGVAYYDINRNGFYDLGEGIGGVAVSVSGTAPHTLTAGSGGYSVPSSNGVRTVSFSAGGVVLGTASVTVRGGTNSKADLILTYPGPSLAGPATPSVGRPNPYTYTAVPGALGYQWRSQTRRGLPSYTAESGEAGVTVNAPGSPFPIVPANGGHAYHLTHFKNLDVQSVTLNPWIRPGANGEVRFQHKLGYAGKGQWAALEIMEEGGSWRTYWKLQGSDGRGATSFTRESIPLGALAGRLVRIRFSYTYTDGVYFDQPNPEVGFLFDTVEFADADEVVPGLVHDLALGEAVSFTPSELQSYELVVRPLRAQGGWPWGPPLTVSAVVGPPPAPQVTGIVAGPQGRLRVDFTLTGTLPGIPILLRAPTLQDPFVSASATLRTNSPGSYSFQYQPGDSAGYLRVSLP